jgi:hypothetical protein
MPGDEILERIFLPLMAEEGQASVDLCQIYYEIACEFTTEADVRARRDKKITERTEKNGNGR